jgi:hypothetical protein
MFFSGSAFIGIDPTAGRKPISYAALEPDLRLTALGSGSLEEVLAFTAGQHHAVVAVCAPRRPNQRLMERNEVRDSLNPQPRPGRWTNFRLAEHLLRQHNISCYKTPSDEKACPNWMKVGFHLYHRLEQMGFIAYPSPKSSLQWLEVYPHACFCTLLGHLPLPKHTLEGRLQRQLVLHQRKLSIHDPMDFVKAITPQTLLQGALPANQLYTTPELDALVAAYTAWQAATHPDQVSSLGEASEGLVYLPVGELKRRY